jgi:hypothetical protein
MADCELGWGYDAHWRYKLLIMFVKWPRVGADLRPGLLQEFGRERESAFEAGE